MNLKVRALLEQLRSMTPLDYAMCSRSELRELSELAFEVAGEADCELAFRLGHSNKGGTTPREEFEVN